MVYFGESLCDLVHDRVYSLLGIANSANSLQIDYEMSLEFLLLNVLSLASRDTAPAEFFALSTALSAAFATQQSTVTLSSCAGQRSEPIDIRVLWQATDDDHSTLPHDLSVVVSPRPSKALSYTFEWTPLDLAFFTSRGYSQGVLDTWKETVAILDDICRCSLCAGQKSVLVCPMQKRLSASGEPGYIDILRVQNSNRSIGIIDTRDFPNVFLVYENAQYLATFLMRACGRDPKRSTIFFDPLSSSWKVGQS